MDLDLTLVINALLAMFVAANVACYVAFRRWPSLLLSENERLSSEYFARFEGELRPRIPEWFDIKIEDWPGMVAEYHKLQGRGGHVYSEFVEFRHPPFLGQFIKFHDAGFRYVRDQGPWPPSPDSFNVFFFGGSTTVGVGPDSTAIPSYVQEVLATRQLTRPVRIYNFGCGSYFSTQERIRFQQLLLAGSVPDLALFLDGVNDFYFFDGRPSIAGFFTQALDAHNRENEDVRWSRVRARPKWGRLREFWSSLPLMRAIDAATEALAKRDATAAEVPYLPLEIEPAELEPAVERYLGNRRQIQTLCREYGVEPFFVWQPSPAYKYDLGHHVSLNRHYGLGGHERSGVGYELMETKRSDLESDGNFLWLADMQEDARAALYLDNVHYTSGFCRTIATHIADALVQRGLLE